jgi:hypothetical protein
MKAWGNAPGQGRIKKPKPQRGEIKNSAIPPRWGFCQTIGSIPRALP